MSYVKPMFLLDALHVNPSSYGTVKKDMYTTYGSSICTVMYMFVEGEGDLKSVAVIS